MFSSTVRKYQEKLHRRWTFQSTPWCYVEIGSERHKSMKEKGWIEVTRPEATTIGNRKYYWVRMQPREGVKNES